MVSVDDVAVRAMQIGGLGCRRLSLPSSFSLLSSFTVALLNSTGAKLGTTALTPMNHVIWRNLKLVNGFHNMNEQCP